MLHRCAFLAFFKKIVHNSKRYWSVWSNSDLLGALAHNSLIMWIRRALRALDLLPRAGEQLLRAQRASDPHFSQDRLF